MYNIQKNLFQISNQNLIFPFPFFVHETMPQQRTKTNQLNHQKKKNPTHKFEAFLLIFSLSSSKNPTQVITIQASNIRFSKLQEYKLNKEKLESFR